MNMHKLADDFLKLSRVDPELVRRLLLKINAAPNHCIPVSEMTPEELELADVLVRREDLIRIPENHGVTQNVHRNLSGIPVRLMDRVFSPTKRKVPERFAITQAGMDTIQSFKFDTLQHEDMSSYRMKAAPNTMKDEDDDQVVVNKELNFKL
jgi:hypothetical protein